VLADKDIVELSNLNRQILHWEKDMGVKKALSAKEKLHEINSDILIEAIPETLDEDNVSRLVGGADLIIDAMDNFPTRYLLNKTALEKKIPFIHGAVLGFSRSGHNGAASKDCLPAVYLSQSTASRELSGYRRNIGHHRTHSGH
jgi:molybdopterin/thiamine biosynthesis adenylyltransferase